MTAPSADTLDRERDKLWLTDAELIRRLGVPEEVARPVIKRLDDDPRSGFPRKQKLWGDRRWWPAVERWMDHTYGVKLQSGAARLAAERPDRTGLPRRSQPAEPMRRALHDN